MTTTEIERLRRMRERGQGQYGAQPRRRTGDEVEHHGETFSGYNQPKRTPSHPTKSHAVLAKEGETVKLIRFGQQGVKGSPPKEGESKSYRNRRRSFQARHAKNIAKGKMSAAYWANRAKWDAAGEQRLGKPCGASHISKAKTCRVQTGTDWRSVAAVTAIAAAAAGGLALSQRNRRGEPRQSRPLNVSELKAAGQAASQNQKLTEDQTNKIVQEALADGKVWDVQEKINARRKAELDAECGGGLGKPTAPAKFDAAVRSPRCQVGEGAFGTYFVHSSEKYGIKLYRNGDEDDVEWEYDRLGRAHAAGVNVPQPLGMNAVKDRDGYTNSQTLVLQHMKGYKEATETYPSPNYNLDKAPLVIQVKALREFRKLHIEGLAHGDIHGGNILVNPKSKKVAIIDFGYSTQIDDYSHPVHSRSGVENLMSDLRRVPDFVGLEGSDFLKRSKGILENIQEKAENYNRDWERYELSVRRYYDYMEQDLLWDDRRKRSRFVSGADQPKIPGLNRRVLTANLATPNRKAFERLANRHPTMMQEKARELGMKPAELFGALQPERKERVALARRQPFGTPL